MFPRPPRSTRTHTLFPHTPLFRSNADTNTTTPLHTHTTYTQHNQTTHTFFHRVNFDFLANFSANLRSEEHTSELQSLMRISYAIFCLKKKKHTEKKHYINIQHKTTIIYKHTHTTN